MSDSGPVSLLNFLGRGRARVVLQSEPAECGLACLATVASHYGDDMDLSLLRDRFPISLKGATLATIMRIGEAMGLASRALRVEPEFLQTMALPAILHWDMSHFVVLTEVSGRGAGLRYYIADPAVGRRTLSFPEVCRSFTGVALEMHPAAGFQPKTERSRLRLRQLWTRTHKLGGALGQIFALTIAMQLATLVSPLFLQFAVDNILPAGDFSVLLALTLGFLIVATIAVAAGLVRGYLITNLGQLLSYQFVVNLSRHMFKLPLSWFEKRQVGDLLSRLESTHPIGEFLSRNLIAALVDGIMAITTLIVMFLYSPLLAFLAIAALGGYAAIRLGLLSTYNRLNEEALVARGREHGMMIENLSGMASIKAFSQENERLSLWVSRKADSVNRVTAVARIQTIWDQLDSTIRALEAVAFVTVAIWLSMTGRLSLGMLFAFAAYKQQFLTASFNLVLMFGTFRTLNVHLQRIAEVALASPEALLDRDLIDRPPVSGRLELSKISYAYGTGEPRILDELDLSIAPGETVAIVGRSGGGKTTLLKLMLGLLLPDTGTIAVDGVALDQFGYRAWRRQVGYVAQDDALYSGSIAQNISFFDPDQDMERVMAAACQAAIHDDILAMPMQYQSLVGDMGSTLSGGQKARVLIARALYREPRILLVDEGSAHLDLETEKKLNEAISALGITRILVSHRPETIERADRVLELRGGRIVSEKAGTDRRSQSGNRRD